MQATTKNGRNRKSPRDCQPRGSSFTNILIASLIERVVKLIYRIRLSNDIFDFIGRRKFVSIYRRRIRLPFVRQIPSISRSLLSSYMVIYEYNFICTWKTKDVKYPNKFFKFSVFLAKAIQISISQKRENL